MSTPEVHNTPSISGRNRGSRWRLIAGLGVFLGIVFVLLPVDFWAARHPGLWKGVRQWLSQDDLRWAVHVLVFSGLTFALGLVLSHLSRLGIGAATLLLTGVALWRDGPGALAQGNLWQGGGLDLLGDLVGLTLGSGWAWIWSPARQPAGQPPGLYQRVLASLWLLLTAAWLGLLVFPVEAWASSRPETWRWFRWIFASDWIQWFFHATGFAGAAFLLGWGLLPRLDLWWAVVLLLSALVALLQEGMQMVFLGFRGWAGLMLDFVADGVGVIFGLVLAYLFRQGRRPRLYDPHFDFLLPQIYRLIHGRRPETLLKLAQVDPAMRVLDVGGGTGRIAQHLPPEATVVVVDPSWNMLRAAPSGAFWYRLRGLAEALPFPGNFFDRVLIVDALHHFLDQTRGLREAWRVLRPGGRIIIEEPDITHPVGRWLPWFERLLLMRSHFLTADQIHQRIPQARVVQVLRQGIRMWLVLEKPGGSRASEGPHG